MKIALDAGHGFGNAKTGVYDTGAQSGGVNEADIALQWALTWKWRLVDAGHKVFLTRATDKEAAPVSTRAARARAAGCDLFIALHCNCANGNASGTETYYRDEGDKPFALAVQNAVCGAIGGPNRGVKLEGESQHNRLAVLNFVPPACLCEIGFIDSPADRTKMLLREVRTTAVDNLLARSFFTAREK